MYCIMVAMMPPPMMAVVLTMPAVLPLHYIIILFCTIHACAMPCVSVCIIVYILFWSARYLASKMLLVFLFTCASKTKLRALDLCHYILSRSKTKFLPSAICTSHSPCSRKGRTKANPDKYAIIHFYSIPLFGRRFARMEWNELDSRRTISNREFLNRMWIVWAERNEFIMCGMCLSVYGAHTWHTQKNVSLGESAYTACSQSTAHERHT